MRTKAPPSLPLFRSEGQGRLLGVLFDRSRAPMLIGDLAVMAEVPVSTAHREVARLERAELVVHRRIGRARLVAANWELPYADALAEVLAHTVGLPGRLRAVLAQVDGIEAALIFGSWAARHRGEGGPPPNDLDLLVIGHVDAPALTAALRPVETTLGLYVNPAVLSPDAWTDLDDPFVATVRSRPTVAVIGSAGMEP